MKRTLYFEAVGWKREFANKAIIQSCHIQTAFHLDSGDPVFLEIYRTADCCCGLGDAYRITADPDDRSRRLTLKEGYPYEYTAEGVLRLVNGLGASFDAAVIVPDYGGYRALKQKPWPNRILGYSYGDMFQYDPEATQRRQAVYRELCEMERAAGHSSPTLFWVDEHDPGAVHFLRYGKYWTARTDVDEIPESWLAAAAEYHGP